MTTRQRRPYVGQTERVLEWLPGPGEVLTRRDWANRPEHVAEAPSHIKTCPQCLRLFDVKVDPASGLHRDRGNDARYCSDTCANTAKVTRQRRTRRGEAPVKQREAPEGSMTDVRAILNFVRRQIALDAWSKLRYSEWLILTAEAPAISGGLHFYEDATLAARDAVMNALRYPEKHEELRRSLIRQIDRFLLAESIDSINNDPAVKAAVAAESAIRRKEYIAK